MQHCLLQAIADLRSTRPGLPNKGYKGVLAATSPLSFIFFGVWGMNDPEIVLAAMRADVIFLKFAGSELLLDPTFCPMEKCRYHILKFTILSGRSVAIPARVSEEHSFGSLEGFVRDRLNSVIGYFIPPDMLHMLHGNEEVPPRPLAEWPGLQPGGEVSEYDPPTDTVLDL
eukprot:5766987-Amphidinium_carterae.1